ncbi:MAG: galactosyltransferase-related protein [Pseudomonadota bacterium]
MQQTLVKNITDNPDTADFQPRFVVLNYGDKGGLHDWIITEPQVVQAIKDGKLIYARTDQKHFRMAHSKNMAHRIAIEHADPNDIICNLDADNWTGQGFAEALYDLFSRDRQIILNPSNEVSKRFALDERGFYGRIALTVENFVALGGYRENFQGWGEEDTDLTRRARRIGLKHCRFNETGYIQIIGHDNETRVRNMYETKEEVEREIARINERNSLSGMKKFAVAAFERAAFIIRPVVAHLGTQFGMGQINFVGLNAVDQFIGPLKTKGSNLYNQVFRGYFQAKPSGYIELLRGRAFGERVISLKGPDGPPQ